MNGIRVTNRMVIGKESDIVDRVAATNFTQKADYTDATEG